MGGGWVVATNFSVKHQGKDIHHPPSTIHKWPLSNLPRSTLCPSLSLSFTTIHSNIPTWLCWDICTTVIIIAQYEIVRHGRWLILPVKVSTHPPSLLTCKANQAHHSSRYDWSAPTHKLFSANHSIRFFVLGQSQSVTTLPPRHLAPAIRTVSQSASESRCLSDTSRIQTELPSHFLP